MSEDMKSREKVFVAPSRLLLELRERLWRRSSDNPDVEVDRGVAPHCLWLLLDAVVAADDDDATDSAPSSSVCSELNVDEDFDFATLLRNAVTALPNIVSILRFSTLALGTIPAAN